MQEVNEDQDHTWTIIAGIIYVSLLIYFGWQTWLFVDWLFPSQQLGMKCLSLLSFDIMALVWGCIDTFDKKNLRGGIKTMIKWAWCIAFILSLLASVLYLVIANMFRFNIPISQTTVNVGEAVSILALVVNVIFLTFFLLYKMGNKRQKTTQSQAIATPQNSVYPVYSPQNEITANKSEAVTRDELKMLIAELVSTNKANKTEEKVKPFLSNQVVARPIKQLPPLHKKGHLLRNPFKRGKEDNQEESTPTE